MTESNKRKLYRSKNDKILAGIFGGLGEYFDIDSNLLRLIGLLFFIFTGFVPFLIIYFISMFIIPSNREESKDEDKNKDEKSSSKPIYKKWWFWLIIILLLLPIILITLGFILFVQRISVTTDVIEIREERIIDQPENNFEIYQEEEYEESI